jgi:membrane protein
MNSPLALKDSRREKLATFWQTLQTWPWKETARTLRSRFREDRLGLTAGSLTFTTTIAMVPFFTVTLAVFSAFPMFSTFQRALERYFLQSLVPDTIAKPVLMALTQFAAKANRLGIVGLVVLLLTALALMLTIDRTLNGIWRVRKPRPIAHRVLVYWAAATLGPLLLGVSLTLTSYVISASQGVVGAMPGAVSMLLSTIEFLLFAAAIAGLFHHVPNTQVRWCHALAGGVFVAVGFVAAKKLLTYYVAKVPTYAMVYGAFATVPILLIWIYLGWVIVLLGAVIAAYAPSLQMRVARRTDTPGYRFNLAAQILRELERARDQHERGCSVEHLARALRADPLQIEPLLHTLVGLDWVGLLDEEGLARYVLLCDPESTPAEPLLATLLLDPGAALSGFRRQARFDQLRLRDVLS